MEATSQRIEKITCGRVYLLLLVPIMLFVFSCFIRPAMVFDTAAGFAVFRSMLEGAPFNYGFSPDPSNIANDIETFLSWWSPGQYLVPGAFVWLGADYGLAISLTALIASVTGVLGWIWIARDYDVSYFVLYLFVAGLVMFHYATSPFRLYSGGEVLLFSALPWSLSALVSAAQSRPAVSFAISFMAAALLFFAKLSGLFAFAASVAAISLLDLWKRRQLTSSLLAMWAGSVVVALLIYVFWVARGPTPVSGGEYTITWPTVLFPIGAAVFSGFSLHELLDWLLLHPSAPILTGIGEASYLIGPLGLILLGWTWCQLRETRYRQMATLLLTIIIFYTAAFILMYIRSGTVIPFEERYFRFVGILSFLLLLVAIDQWRAPLAKVIAILVIGAFAMYGVTSYANGARELRQGHHYDPVSGTSMLLVSPDVLEYLRSEMAMHNWQHAIAVVPDPEAGNGLPRFRILFSFHLLDSAPIDDIARQTWAGRTDKIFVIIDSRMHDPNKVDAVLRTFVDYDFRKWDRKEIDGMLVASQ